MVNVFYTYNRGYKNPIVLPELISIQSSDDYNGLHINESNAVQAGNKLFIGSVGENDNTHVTADFYQLLLFDRVLTDKEREWVKENLIEPNTVSATKACSALFEPENLEIIDEFPNGVIRDSLGGEYYLLPHSSDYTIENGLMKSTDDTFLISIENANENDVKAMIIDMYYDSTVPGSYLNGEYTEGSVKLTNRRIMGINNPTTTSIFQDLMQVLETGFTIGKIALYNKELNKDEFDSEAFHKGFAVRHSTFENPSNSSISSTYVYDIEREGDLTYPEDKEECIAYGMSTSPNRLIWGDYETTEPLKFTDYITIHSGHNMLAEFYYKTDNIGYINSYILIFKKDKVTEQVYKTYIRVTKELLNSIHGVNNLLIELTYTGSIGSKWEEFDDELLYKPYIRTKGTFAQKPLSSQGIQQGFSYFCTDKQTVEGSRSGIMIYYAGNDTWVDALGRYV